MADEEHLHIPLSLGELLFVTLGPLIEVLEKEDHRWAPVCRMVLKAYVAGRDDQIAQRYGDHVVKDIDLITLQVADDLAEWVAEMATEEKDFEKWDQELGDVE